MAQIPRKYRNTEIQKYGNTKYFFLEIGKALKNLVILTPAECGSPVALLVLNIQQEIQKKYMNKVAALLG